MMTFMIMYFTWPQSSQPVLGMHTVHFVFAKTKIIFQFSAAQPFVLSSPFHTTMYLQYVKAITREDRL